MKRLLFISALVLLAVKGFGQQKQKADSIVYAKLLIFGESDKPGERYRYTFTVGSEIKAENFDDYMMPFEKYGSQGWVLVTCYQSTEMGLSNEMNFIFQKTYKRK